MIQDPYDHPERNALPVTVAPGTNQAFWVDVCVPKGTTAGDHTGTVTVSWGSDDQDPPTVLALALTVHPFTLPSISRYKTTYNCPIL